jgi:O-antigen/teichoic acid export membrane protein
MPRFDKINALQIYQILQFGTAILIGILLVKAGLPTAGVSVYESWMFIASLFCFFWVAGGQNALLQLYAKLDEATQRRAIFNVFLLFLLIGLMAGGLLLLSQGIVSQKLTNFDELPFINLLALYLALNSPSFLLQIFFLLLKKYSQLVWYGAVSFGLQLLLVVVPIALGFSLRESMVGLLVWALVKLVWSLIVVLNHAELRFDAAFFKKYAHLAMPLLVFSAIGKGSEYVSGLAVSNLFTDEKVFAIFRYGAREMPLAVLMVGALATALIPEMAENQALGLELVKSKTKKLSHWLYPISMVTMLAAPLLFPIFFNQDFKVSARIFNIFTLLLASRILLPQVVAMGAGKNKILITSALAELIVLTVLSFWWGRVFGLEGIAWAAVVAFMVDRVILLGYNWRVLNIRPSAYVDWKTWAAYNLLLFATFLISSQL